jgi:tetraacyldisaccharide 4'-kinase
MDKFFNNIWYGGFNIFSLLLLPFTLIYFIIITLRIYLYRFRFFKAKKFDVPIIIIGNISLGGSGKTPFCIWLVNHLESKNIRVGVISSGYKGSSKNPTIVDDESNPVVVGDEAVLLFEKTSAKIVSCGNRVEATRLLLNTFKVDVIIHDDGIQHYALDRDYEIILIDNNKLFGNGFLFPSGPLRELQSRITRANISILMNLESNTMYAACSDNKGIQNAETKEIKTFDQFRNKKIHLVAGIASIDNITSVLDNYMIDYITHKYEDHYQFSGNEFDSFSNEPIFLTSKDYVKLHTLDNKNIWILLHEVVPNNLLIKKINQDLASILKYEN